MIYSEQMIRLLKCIGRDVPPPETADELRARWERGQGGFNTLKELDRQRRIEETFALWEEELQSGVLPPVDEKLSSYKSTSLFNIAVSFGYLTIGLAFGVIAIVALLIARFI